jgi:succinyl-CoA synthetase alpha subunit
MTIKFTKRIQAKSALNPSATVLFIPALLAATAMEEAIQAKIPLLVSITKHIPAHDMLHVQQILRT